MYRIYSFIQTWCVQNIAWLTFCTVVSGACAQQSPFPALVANPLEARVGSIVEIDAKRLRLDIGASVTFHEFFQDTARGWLTLGADFMTYTRLRSENNFKFPVETSDYFFGINTQYKFPDSALHLRARIAHISSHLVDGFANANGVFQQQLPFVYSREFVEVIVAYQIGFVRPYIGATALWATQPRTAERIIPEIGFDVDYPIGGKYLVRAGYDYKIVGIDGIWVTSQAAQLGIFGKFLGDHGLLLSLYGMNGRSMHGMFFNQAERYWGIGFQIL